jgi:hypothetical protein
VTTRSRVVALHRRAEKQSRAQALASRRATKTTRSVVGSSWPPLRAEALPVVVVVVTKRPWLAEQVAHLLRWQEQRPTRVVICTVVAEYDISPIRDAIAEVDLVIAQSGTTLRGLRNLGAQRAVDAAGADAIVATMDDDDLYGPDYLRGIVDAWRRHPEAIIVGRACYGVLHVSEPPKHVPGGLDSTCMSGPCPGVAGSTISFRASTWRSRAAFRYPSEGGIGEDIQLLEIARRMGLIVSAYFGTYRIVRYSNPDHGHIS